MRVVFVLLSLSLLPLSLSAAEKLKVITSFSILADMAYQVGGDNIQIINIVARIKTPTRIHPQSMTLKTCSKQT
jgi:ABC-type Zn uptake system ZnuABC Zn-binding protein ZnuA